MLKGGDTDLFANIEADHIAFRSECSRRGATRLPPGRQRRRSASDNGQCTGQYPGQRCIQNQRSGVNVKLARLITNYHKYDTCDDGILRKYN